MEKVTIQCAKCAIETEHILRIHEYTAANILIEGRCSKCGNVIKIPMKGNAARGNLKSRIEALRFMAARHDQIVKTPVVPPHHDLKKKKED